MRINAELRIKGSLTTKYEDKADTNVEDVNPAGQLPVFDVSEATVTNSSGGVS